MFAKYESAGEGTLYFIAGSSPERIKDYTSYEGHKSYGLVNESGHIIFMPTKSWDQIDLAPSGHVAIYLGRDAVVEANRRLDKNPDEVFVVGTWSRGDDLH